MLFAGTGSVVVKRGKVVVDQFVVDGIYRLELFPR